MRSESEPTVVTFGCSSGAICVTVSIASCWSVSDDPGHDELGAAAELDAGVEARLDEEDRGEDDQDRRDREPDLAPADDVVRPTAGVEVVAPLGESGGHQCSFPSVRPDSGSDSWAGASTGASVVDAAFCSAARAAARRSAIVRPPAPPPTATGTRGVLGVGGCALVDRILDGPALGGLGAVHDPATADVAAALGCTEAPRVETGEPVTLAEELRPREQLHDRVREHEDHERRRSAWSDRG